MYIVVHYYPMVHGDVVCSIMSLLGATCEHLVLFTTVCIAQTKLV